MRRIRRAITGSMAVLLLALVIQVVTPPTPSFAAGTYSETTGSTANTWTNYTNAGGNQGPTIPSNDTIQIACRLQGFTVADGNNWWYQIASSPWNYTYYVSADPFYNNGQTSGILHGTPFVDTNVPVCGSAGGISETTGSTTNTWTNFSNAGGTQGPTIGSNQTVQITCRTTGFAVADGNTWWYEIASSPWDDGFYASADAFYNNGQTSGSLQGTPFYDPNVPICGGSSPPPAGNNETTGSATNAWTDYSNAGGSQGPTISSNATVQITCKVIGFAVADGNTWWYEIASSPWSDGYFASADAFYNNGQTSGSLVGTPFVDPNVPTCSGSPKTPTSPAPTGDNETTGSTTNTWTDYSDAGGTQGPTVPSNETVQVTCRISGFAVADGNTWWYLVAASPWNDDYYASADAFYNNGGTSGSLQGTPFVDPNVPTCSPGQAKSPTPTTTSGNETTGSVANTWTDYADAGGNQGPTIPSNDTIQIACKVTGFAVADGNTWWYQVASSPWNGTYYVSADPFYNNGQTSGTLHGTPFVDSSIPTCSNPGISRPSGETVGPGGAQTWANYSHAGAAEGQTIPAYTTVQVACRASGFAVADSNSWWYQVSSSPWDDVYYVSADAFYNNGATSGSLTNTPFYDPAVPVCVNNQEQPVYSTAYGSSSASVGSQPCQTQDPVDCASGDFWQSYTDVSVHGRGPGLDLTRTYNDLAASTPGMFGYGWSSSYDQHLTLNADGSVTVTLADGSQIVAEPNAAGGFTVPPWADSSLILNANGTYIFTRQATEILTFSSSGTLMSLRDLNGYATTLSYNASNQLDSVTDSAGRTLTVNVGANGFVSSVVDPLGRKTTYGYDSSGDLTSVTDPMGRTTKFTYDGNHQMLTVTDPRGGVVTNTYDTEGRVIAQTDAAGLRTTYVYSGDNFSSLGGLTTITDPHGNVEVKQYVNGFLTRLTKAYGTSAQATWTYTYDPTTYGVASVTDSNGNLTTNTYNSNGQLLTSTDPLGNVTTNTYNAFNEVLTSTTPLGATTTNTYDATGNLLSATDPLGNVTTYAYGDGNAGDVTSVTDADGHVTGFTYDGDGDVASATVTPSQGVNDTTVYTYDKDSEQVCEAPADATAAGASCPSPGKPRIAGTTTTVYDADGEVTSVTDGSGHTTGRAYDADGNQVKETDPLGSVTTSTYDADDRLASTTSGANGNSPSTTSYAYDLAPGSGVCGSVSGATYCNTTTNPNGGVTVDYFDAANNEIQETLPDGQATRYTYDLDGNRLTETDAAGRTTTNTYDGDSRLTSTSYSDGITPDVVYAYNADGRRTAMTDGTGITSYTYDADGHTTSVMNGANAVVSYTYDGDGNVISLTYPNGQSIIRSYDRANRLTSTKDWLGNTTAFAYDPNGNLLETIYPNGDTIKSTYSPTNTLLTTGVSASGSTQASISYTRDAAGLITQEVDTGALTGTTTNYAYNAKEQLTSAGSTSFAYDLAGNLVSDGGTTQTFNAADQLTSSGVGANTTSYGYDSVGDLASVAPSSGTATHYTYDQAGRLVSASPAAVAPTVIAVTPAAGSATGGTSVTITGGVFTGTTKVLFGTIPAASFTVVSATKVVAVAPAGSAGNVDVSVVTPSGTSAPTATDQFTYGGPAITAVFPAWGLTPGNKPVTITGTGFTGTTKVFFGTVPAKSFSVVSSTSITAVSPAQGAGTYNVSVASPDGTSAVVPADSFTYSVPVITAISPRSGPTDGGNVVTITGNGFTGATSVLFGSVAASSYSVVSASKITATVPAQVNGTYGVSVTTPAGVSGQVAADAYTNGTPAISSISPTSGVAGGNAVVTVSGSGFTGTSKVLFGTVVASAFSVISGSEIVAVSPAQASGTYKISVTTPGGTSAAVPSDLFNDVAVASGTSTYNADGLRVTETSASGTKSFTWDSTPSVPEILNDGTNSYIYGPGGLPIEQISGSGTPSYFFQDADGSTRALLTSTGAIGATYSYTPYGSVKKSTGTLQTPLLYAQSYSDPATGLVYLINRYYNPGTAQFTSEDPDLSATGQPYEYSGDDPLNFNDPIGLFDWDPLSHWRGISQAVVSVAAGTAIAACVASIICDGGIAAVLVIGGIGGATGAANYALGGGQLTISGFAINALVGIGTSYLGGALSFAANVVQDVVNSGSGHAGETYSGSLGSGSTSGSAGSSRTGNGGTNC